MDQSYRAEHSGFKNTSAVGGNKHSQSVGILDPLRDRAHQLIKKMSLVYSEASKVDLAYEGLLSLMKGWLKTSASQRKAEVEDLIKKLEVSKDEGNLKDCKNKLLNHRQSEANIVSTCQTALKGLIEAIERDIDTISKELVAKSKKLSNLKVEMDKVEPGKQIPAVLKVTPDLPK